MLSPTTVFYVEKKTGKSNILMTFLLKKRGEAEQNIRREARRSWAGEVSKANEQAVVCCGIHDWLTEGKLFVYPQHTI